MKIKTDTIQLSDLNAELDRVGLVAYDGCEVTSALDEETAVPPYGIVRLSWGAGETDYYRAGELAEALVVTLDELAGE